VRGNSRITNFAGLQRWRYIAVEPDQTVHLEYEEESEVSLAIGADVLRVLSADGVALQDLPAVSGVSKEAITAAINFLRRQGYAVIEPAPSDHSRLVRLTAKGLAAQAQHTKLVEAVEQRWRKRLGGDFDRLTKALITGRQLALGLKPYPDGWRAARNPYRRQTEAVLADPASALPRYPMVTHRGGYPDGS
jgi:DNA-binding MarR family transcriptional regulator